MQKNVNRTTITHQPNYKGAQLSTHTQEHTYIQGLTYLFGGQSRHV